ncbi:MAG: haloacid dehalogenase-like hydrolase [Dehalococcoidia bacterium]|nr:haloacid dehalogenase-like hydrolase [Dehalococcoidia bacterium]
MSQPQNVIALVYDYDKTLSPFHMQEDVIFEKIGVNSKEFWGRVDRLTSDKTYESDLAWIRLLLDNLFFRNLSNSDLSKMGKELNFFPGIPKIFEELDSILSDEKFVRHGITLEHYIVTSGLQAVLAGSDLAKYVKRIFGCEFDEDGQGKVYWPKRVISHTAKTQYLFRITKGFEYMNFEKDVNDHVPEIERRIPFRNMLYIGDGPTDVPCFSVITSRGGKALAVYDANSKHSFETCMSLRAAQRVNEIAEADYRRGTHLRRIIEYMVYGMAEQIVVHQEMEHDSRVIHAPKHG